MDQVRPADAPLGALRNGREITEPVNAVPIKAFKVGILIDAVLLTVRMLMVRAAIQISAGPVSFRAFFLGAGQLMGMAYGISLIM